MEIHRYLIYISLILFCFVQVSTPETLNPNTDVTNTSYQTVYSAYIPDSGVGLLQSGKYNEAISYYNTRIQQNPNEISSLINKGLALNALGRYDESLQSFGLALAQEPENVAALNNKALVLTTLGRGEEALSYYDHVLAIDPNSIDALNNKGFTLSTMGKQSDALQVFQKVIQLDPQYVEAWNNQGLCLLELGKYEEADAMFDKATLLDPDDPVYWNNKGLALFKAGKTKEALSAYEMAVNIHAIAHHENNALGSVIEQYERDNAVLSKILQMSQVNHLDAKSWADVSSIFYSYGLQNEAQGAYERSIQLDPSYREKIQFLSPFSTNLTEKNQQTMTNSTILSHPSQINNFSGQKVTGKVKYYIVQQGWTVSLPGTITGVLSPDTGEIKLNSTDAVISYGGTKYPVNMQIEGTVE